MEYFKSVKRKNAQKIADIVLHSYADFTNVPLDSSRFYNRLFVAFLMERCSNGSLLTLLSEVKSFSEPSEFIKFIDDLFYWYEF